MSSHEGNWGDLLSGKNAARSIALSGGIFADIDAWRLAFAFLLPVTLVYAWVVWRALPADSRKRKPSARLPLIQLLLLTAAVLAISIGSTESQLSYNLMGVALAVLMVALLIRQEFVSDTCLLPRNALRLRSPLLSLYLTIGLLVVGMTSETFVPYFLQNLHGQTPLMSGYLAALMAAGWTLAEIWSSGWRAKKVSLAIVAGPLLVLAGMAMLAFSVPVQSGSTRTLVVIISLGLYWLALVLDWAGHIC